jgi:hypothetical protein
MAEVEELTRIFQMAFLNKCQNNRIQRIGFELLDLTMTYDVKYERKTLEVIITFMYSQHIKGNNFQKLLFLINTEISIGEFLINNGRLEYTTKVILFNDTFLKEMIYENLKKLKEVWERYLPVFAHPLFQVDLPESIMTGCKNLHSLTKSKKFRKLHYDIKSFELEVQIIDELLRYDNLKKLFLTDIAIDILNGDLITNYKYNDRKLQINELNTIDFRDFFDSTSSCLQPLLSIDYSLFCAQLYITSSNDYIFHIEIPLHRMIKHSDINLQERNTKSLFDNGNLINAPYFEFNTFLKSSEIVKIPKIPFTPASIQRYEAYRSLSHKNMLKVFNIIKYHENFWAITEEHSVNGLKDYINCHFPSESLKFTVISQLISLIEECTFPIYLSAQSADFQKGEIKIIPNLNGSIDPAILSYEELSSSRYVTMSSEIYRLGLLIYDLFLVSGSENPYVQHYNDCRKSSITHKNFLDDRPIPIPAEIQKKDPKLVYIFRELTETDPASRITLSDLKTILDS